MGAEAGGLSERVTSDTGDSDTDRVQQEPDEGLESGIGMNPSLSGATRHGAYMSRSRGGVRDVMVQKGSELVLLLRRDSTAKAAPCLWVAGVSH